MQGMNKPSPRPATMPIIAPGVITILRVPYSELVDALQREGWAGRTLSIKQAKTWAKNQGHAPREVDALISRQRIRRQIADTMAPHVGSILGINPLGIANRARKGGHTTYIDAETANAWILNPQEAPRWVSDMLKIRDQRAVDAAQRKADAVSATEHQRREDTERRIIDGWILRDKHRTHVDQIYHEAIETLTGLEGASGLSIAGATLLASRGIDIADPSTWLKPDQPGNHKEATG
jgi:hypothetical protein